MCGEDFNNYGVSIIIVGGRGGLQHFSFNHGVSIIIVGGRGGLQHFAFIQHENVLTYVLTDTLKERYYIIP